MTRTRAIVRIVAVAPLVMAVGLALAAVSQVEDASGRVIAVWVVALAITGIGVGMAWPHLSAWAMGCVDDPGEGGTAAAAINTVQLICGAFGAGLAGVVVNLTDRGDATRGALAVRDVRRAGGGRRGVVALYEKLVVGQVDRHHELVEDRPAVLAAAVARRLVGTWMPSASTKSETYWIAEKLPATSTR